MRNTLEYKVTRREVLDTLEEILQKETQVMRPGDLAPMIISKIEEVLHDAKVYETVFGHDDHFERG